MDISRYLNIGESPLKFLIQRSLILPLLTQALETCSSGNKQNTYMDFLIELSDSVVSVTSINNYAQQSIHVEVKGMDADKSASFTVTGKKLVDFLKQCQDEELECVYSEKSHALKIASATRKMEYAFITGSASEFQPITFQPGVKTFTVPGVVLAQAFGYTYPATNKESSHRPFTAVKLAINNDKLNTESTDKSRIAVYEAEIQDTGAENFFALIPREVAEALSKIVAHVDSVTIRECNRHVVFEWDNTVFVTSLETDAENEFVSLKDFFNNTVVADCHISRDDLIRSVRIAALLDADAEIYVSCDQDGLRLKTIENEIGAGIDTLPVRDVNGSSMCCLPLKHFLKSVESCDEAFIKVKWSELENGEVACGVEDGNESLKFYVFPVKSKDEEIEE